MPKKFRVSDEEQAWYLLSEWLRTGDMPEVDFVGWPVLRIKVEGDDYESSLNSNQMSALVDLKMTIGRAYAMVTHGAYDMRRLKSDEEEQLDFNTKVKRGSSILETDLTPLVEALAHATSQYPGATLAVGLILGLAFVARPIVLKHYELRAQQLEVEDRARLLGLGMSRQDEAKVSLFDEALKRVSKLHPQINQALPDARHAFWRFATASADAETMEVAGLVLSSEDLEILSERRGRRSAEYEEVTKVFVVTGINKIRGVYRIKLESPDLIVTAAYRRPQMTEGRVRSLFQCISQNRPILATLDVKTVEKSQLSARLMKFKPLDVSEEEIF